MIIIIISRGLPLFRLHNLCFIISINGTAITATIINSIHNPNRTPKVTVNESSK